jgi:hypothetical protein
MSLDGKTAGLVATIPMTAAMEAAWTQLPLAEKYPLPPREITEYVGRATGVWPELPEPVKEGRDVDGSLRIRRSGGRRV